MWRGELFSRLIWLIVCVWQHWRWGRVGINWLSDWLVDSIVHLFIHSRGLFDWRCVSDSTGSRHELALIDWLIQSFIHSRGLFDWRCVSDSTGSRDELALIDWLIDWFNRSFIHSFTRLIWLTVLCLTALAVGTNCHWLIDWLID